MITRIEATNYRCFERLDVDLGSVGVLVGANGAGKTTLLDIPVLFRDLLEQSGKQSGVGSAFLEAIQPRGARASTFSDLLHKGRGDRFSFAVEAMLPKFVTDELVESASGFVKENPEHWPRFVRYEVGFEVFNQRELNITSEFAFAFSEKDVPQRSTLDDINAVRIHGDINPHKRWIFALQRSSGAKSVFRTEVKLASQSRRPPSRSLTVPANRMALAALAFESRDHYPAARWLLDTLTEDAVFFDPNWSALRSASPPGQANTVVADGLNLPWLAMGLHASSPERFQRWKEHVRLALPQVSDIEAVEREEDHHAYFRVTYNGDYSVTSSGLSDGTLRILALTLLPYLDSPPILLAVEEPENGIHPRAIEVVLEGLSSMNDCQVLMSSHSPVVVANTPIEQLLTAHLNRDGAVTVRAGSEHPRLVDWKGSIDLGALFAAGVLG